MPWQQEDIKKAHNARVALNRIRCLSFHEDDGPPQMQLADIIPFSDMNVLWIYQAYWTSPSNDVDMKSKAVMEREKLDEDKLTI